VTEVDSYILQAAGVKKNHRIVQIGYKPVKTGPNGYDPIVAIKKNKKFPLALIFSRPVNLFFFSVSVFAFIFVCLIMQGESEKTAKKLQNFKQSVL
jgi:hypothetical protein